MLGFFIGFLTVILAIVSLLMVFIVLMQRPKQEGLGAAFGAGVTDQMWGAQTTNVLQKGTVYLAVLFFGITLTLAVLVNAKQKGVKALNEKLSVSDPASEVLPETPSIGSGDTTFDNINLLEGSGAPTPPAIDSSIKLDAPTTAPVTEDVVPPAPITAPAAADTTPAPDVSDEDAADAVKKLLEEASAAPGEAAIEAVEEAVGTPE